MAVTSENAISDWGKIGVLIHQDMKELVEPGSNRRDRETDMEQLVCLIGRILGIDRLEHPIDL